MENKNIIKYLVQGIILLLSSATGFLSWCLVLWSKLGLSMSVPASCAILLISFFAFVSFMHWIGSNGGEDE